MKKLMFAILLLSAYPLTGQQLLKHSNTVEGFSKYADSEEVNQLLSRFATVVEGNDDYKGKHITFQVVFSTLKN